VPVDIHDVAVVGLGAVGSAALLALARRGIRAIGIDRHAPPHHLGSSHGESRITRQAIGEGLAYVPLVLRSNVIWEDLESLTGERLLERCGFLYITRDGGRSVHHGKVDFLQRTVRAARTFGIAHDLLDAPAIAARFPHFTGLVGDETGYFEPGGGFLRPENCIAACLTEAQRLGARALTHLRVGALTATPQGVRIETEDGPILARRAILAVGSWAPAFPGVAVARRIVVHRQVLHWFDVEDRTSQGKGSSPTFIWTHGQGDADQFYGFPPIAGEVKVAQEDYDGEFDPEISQRRIGPAVGQAMAARHVRGRLAGLSRSPTRSELCHYAVTPDSDFIIDVLDECVIFASACSGHGFKHAAAVGEGLAQWAIGETGGIDLSPFSSARFSSPAEA
jgi:sarcosine oxidase